MSRSTVNFLLDVFLLLSFVALLVASIIDRSVFPAPSQSAGWTVWTLDHDGWATLRFGLLLVRMVAVGVHLILHWSWVCGFVAARLSNVLGRRITTNESTRTLYGVMTLIAVLCVLLSIVAAAYFSAVPPAAVVFR
jgi:hypothetical protein